MFIGTARIFGTRAPAERNVFPRGTGFRSAGAGDYLFSRVNGPTHAILYMLCLRLECCEHDINELQ